MRRVVVITGAVGGIGRATAAAFSAAGWCVFGVDRVAPPEGLTYDHFVQADVADETASQSLFAQVQARAGRLDALVNNAAVQVCKPLVDTEPAEWDAVMATNLRSVYLAIRFGYPLLEKAGGAIINVSSVHAVATSVNIAAYAASKGGLLALTRAAALELAPRGIRVNAVLPGAVDTPMLRSGLARGHVGQDNVADQLDELRSRHPLGRVGRPEEIGQAILFLADADRSAFVTGQSLIVDGGATARLSTE